jgi:DNA repair protein RecO (recombination protein O)
VPRPRVYLTEAIVLRQQDYAEADRILTVLTPGGKRSVLARGIRRPTSRRAGHLGLFHRANVKLAQGRQLDIVTEAESLDAHEGLWHDLLRFTYACYAAELVDQFLPEEEESPEVYQLLTMALRAFANEPDLRLWARWFELALLRLSGYHPEFFACVSCGAPIQPEANRFDVTQGGFLCPRCAVEAPGARPVSLASQRVLRFLATRDAQEIARLAIREGTHRELEQLLQAFLQYTLERELRSTAFLRRLRDELAMHEAARGAGGGASSDAV